MANTIKIPPRVNGYKSGCPKSSDVLDEIRAALRDLYPDPVGDINFDDVWMGLRYAVQSDYSMMPSRVLGVNLSITDTKWRKTSRSVGLKDGLLNLDKVREKYAELLAIKKAEQREADEELAKRVLMLKAYDALVEETGIYKGGFNSRPVLEPSGNYRYTIKINALDADQVRQLVETIKRIGV